MPDLRDVRRIDVDEAALAAWRKQVADALVVKPSGTAPVVTHVPAYAWRCQECGWLGTGHTSQQAADKEGRRHLFDDHGIALCFVGEYGGLHDWQEVRGSDSLSTCSRCHWTIGK